jgi:hypothetical protein
MRPRYNTYHTDSAVVGEVLVDGETVSRNNFPVGPNSREQAVTKAENWARDAARNHSHDEGDA